MSFQRARQENAELLGEGGHGGSGASTAQPMARCVRMARRRPARGGFFAEDFAGSDFVGAPVFGPEEPDGPAETGGSGGVVAHPFRGGA